MNKQCIILIILLMAFEPLIGKQAISYDESNARLNIWHGSVRSSKTVTSIFRWLNYINEEAPEGELLMTGKTLTTLNRNILTPMSEITGEEYTLGGKETKVLGRKVQLEGANDERAEGKVRGMTIAGHYGDEITLWPESYFTMGLSRMSVANAKFFGTTNPDSPYHWLNKKYLKREDVLSLQSFSFKLDDNPYLDEEFVKQLKLEYTGLWYDRFIDGKWAVAEGIIYDMFDPDKHVVSELPKMQRYFIGVDYGTSNPTVFVLIGQDFEGALYIVDEYRHAGKTGKTKTDVDYVKDLKPFLPNNYKNICIDPSAASFMAACRKANIVGVRKANNDVLDGIRSVASLLSNEMLFIHERCEHCIQGLTTYAWNKKAQERGEDKPKKENDHEADAIRYGIYTNKSYWHAILQRKSQSIDRLAGARI